MVRFGRPASSIPSLDCPVLYATFLARSTSSCYSARIQWLSALPLAFRDSTIAEEVQTSGTHQGILTLPYTPNQRLDHRPLEFVRAVKPKAFVQAPKE
jgi:hypothetical protein